MKRQELQRSELATTPTGPRPGDFPIGSAKSRAAARALVSARRPKLTTEDLECLLIYRMTEYLRASAWPSYSEMEKLPVWQRGWELFKASNGYKEWREALRELAAGRPFNPSAIKRMGNPPVTAEGVKKWRAVWERLVPEYPFPFKFETGFLYARAADYVVSDPVAYGETGKGALKGFQRIWPPRFQEAIQKA